MSNTYYLLRSKGAAVGDGPYLGVDADGSATIVGQSSQGQRFALLQAAEQHAAEMQADLGKFEIEIRNSVD